MFRKINNKALLILFGILAILVVAVFIYDRKKGDRTFRSELFSVDSANVTNIKIYPKGKISDPLILEKSGKKWEIKVGSKKYPADSSAVGSILSSLVHVTAERVAASDASGWKGLEISDSSGRHVVVEHGNVVDADFWVGKVSFSQNPGMQNRGRNQGFSVKSHIRVAGDDRVYVVDGFLSMILSDDPSHYRNRLICKFDRNLVTKMTFVYPGDSSFILARNGIGWTINGKPADSTKTTTFINSIASTNSAEFADNNNIPVVFPFSLKIEGNNMPPIEITGANDPTQKKYFIRSSANTSAVFASPNANLFNKVFTSKSKF